MFKLRIDVYLEFYTCYIMRNIIIYSLEYNVEYIFAFHHSIIILKYFCIIYNIENYSVPKYPHVLIHYWMQININIINFL